MKSTLLLFPLVPGVLIAEGLTPSIGFTSTSIDKKQTCASCHTNSTGGTGSVAVDLSSYNPGVQTTIHVTITDPAATIWGFQMTIRSVSDPATPTGSFVASSTVQARCDDGSKFGSLPPC